MTGEEIFGLVVSIIVLGYLIVVLIRESETR